MLALGNFKEVEGGVKPALKCLQTLSEGLSNRHSGLGSCNGQKDFRVRSGAWSPLLVTPRCIQHAYLAIDTGDCLRKAISSVSFMGPRTTPVPFYPVGRPVEDPVF